jgi:hypothetical protein
MEAQAASGLLSGLLGGGMVGGFMLWFLKRQVARLDDVEKNCASKGDLEKARLECVAQYQKVDQRVDKEIERLYEQEIKALRQMHDVGLRDLRSDMNGLGAQLRQAVSETKQDINQKLDIIVELVRSKG